MIMYSHYICFLYNQFEVTQRKTSKIIRLMTYKIIELTNTKFKKKFLKWHLHPATNKEKETSG